MCSSSSRHCSSLGCVHIVPDPHPGFAVSTHDWTVQTPVADVVNNGLVLPLWMGDDQTGQFNLLDVNTNSQTFYLWMNNGTAQAFNVVAAQADVNILSISISPQFGLARPPNAGFSTAQVTVQFSCLQSTGFGFVSVSISVDPFDPFTVAWFKNCEGAAVPSSGMSGVGVFFLTTFLLITVGCMGGCAFKYVKLHARGAEIIPGIDTWRGLYARCFQSGGPAYDNVVYKSSVGPQAQFDQTATGTGQTSGANPFQAGSYQNL